MEPVKKEAESVVVVPDPLSSARAFRLVCCSAEPESETTGAENQSHRRQRAAEINTYLAAAIIIPISKGNQKRRPCVSHKFQTRTKRGN